MLIRLVVLGLLASDGVAAQQPNRGVVVATVLEAESAAPLSDVTFRLMELRLTSRTDSSGVALFRNVPSGRHTLEGRRLGYTPATAIVSVAGSDTTEIIVFMRAMTTRLPQVTVTEKATPIPLREFEERRRSGRGRYITQEQLDEAFGSDLSAILTARFPGVRSGATVWNQRGGHCTLRAYLDGVHLLNDSVTDVDPVQLAGVEYYTMTSIPVQYRSQGTAAGGGQLGCGVILFWSKAK